MNRKICRDLPTVGEAVCSGRPLELEDELDVADAKRAVGLRAGQRPIRIEQEGATYELAHR